MQVQIVELLRSITIQILRKILSYRQYWIEKYNIR